MMQDPHRADGTQEDGTALLLVSLLAALAVLVAWLVGEHLDQAAWRRAADAWTRARPFGGAETLDRALASRS